MSEYCIFLFGKFDVRYNDQHISAFNSTNVQQLLSYLLLNRNRQLTREALAALFWPEATPTQSKAYLRKTLWQLQGAFNNQKEDQNKPLIVADNEWIFVNPEADIWLDVARVEQAFKQTEGISGEAFSEEALATADEAVQVYRGELLAGWSQEWCLYERERLYQYCIIMLDKLMNYCLHKQQYEQGLIYAMKILGQDPARERTHRALMRLHYLAGDRTSALRQYNTCTEILREELDVRPSERTQRLYKSICMDEVKAILPVKTHLTGSIDEEQLLTALHSLERARADLTTVQSRLDQEIAALQDIISSHHNNRPFLAGKER